MRHVLQGFTMHIGDADFGYDTETVTIPLPTQKTEQYQGGGMPLEVNLPMGAVSAIEINVKMSGRNPDIMGMVASGITRTINFRGGVLSDIDGSIVAHVITARGQMNGSNTDQWQRGTKSGFEFVINGLIYFKYMAGDVRTHELSAWPPIWVVNGVDATNGLSAALGY